MRTMTTETHTAEANHAEITIGGINDASISLTAEMHIILHTTKTADLTKYIPWVPLTQLAAMDRVTTDQILNSLRTECSQRNHTGHPHEATLAQY